MQKKLIALAIAGLSGAAFAQSNVTVYGVMDGSFETISATGATANGVGAADNAQNLNSRSRIVSNSSYLGFKGSEDLGGGLKAVFQIETQYAMDNAGPAGTQGTAPLGAGNTLGNRDTYAALAGNFGTALMGYVSTPHRNLGASFDVMPGATGVAGFNNLIGKINVGASKAANGTTTNTFGATNVNAIFRTQAVAYATPSFNGFSGVIAYVPNEARSAPINNQPANVANPNSSGWDLGLNYDNGPIRVGYSYLEVKDVLGAASGAFVGGNQLSSSKLKSHLFAAGYTFGGATTVNFMYNSNKIDANSIVGNSNGLNSVKNNVWGLGLKHVMGAHEIAAVYQRAADGTVGVEGANAAVTSSDRGANFWGLRYGYNFSKRTQLYGVYSRITNKSNGNYDFGAGTGASGVGGTAALSAGADPTSFGVGIRHSF